MEPLTMFQTVQMKRLMEGRAEPLPWLGWWLSWKDRFYLRHYVAAAWWVIQDRWRRGKR